MRIGTKDKFLAQVARSRPISDPKIIAVAEYQLEQFRNGQKIFETKAKNAIGVVGFNAMLDTMFGNSTPLTQVNPWYFGLINNSPTPTLLTSDTLLSHSGWAEWTAYSGSRKAWDDANAASAAKGSNAISTFTVSAIGNIYGAFLASVASGTSGVLWSTGAFEDVIPVIVSDDIKVSYSVQFVNG